MKENNLNNSNSLIPSSRIIYIDYTMPLDFVKNQFLRDIILFTTRSLLIISSNVYLGFPLAHFTGLKSTLSALLTMLPVAFSAHV